MPQLNNLLSRSGVALAVILISAIFFAPNLVRQNLVIVFHDTYRTADGDRVSVSPEEVADFIHDRENGLRLFFQVLADRIRRLFRRR